MIYKWKVVLNAGIFVEVQDSNIIVYPEEGLAYFMNERAETPVCVGLARLDEISIAYKVEVFDEATGDV